MLQGGNSSSIHLQPSFHNSLTLGHFPASHLPPVARQWLRVSATSLLAEYWAGQ